MTKYDLFMRFALAFAVALLWFDLGTQVGKRGADRWYHDHPQIVMAHLQPCTKDGAGYGECEIPQTTLSTIAIANSFTDRFIQLSSEGLDIHSDCGSIGSAEWTAKNCESRYEKWRKKKYALDAEYREWHP